MQINYRRMFARAVWLNVHVYLALSVGLLFVLLGITGSLNVYREELDRILNPRLTIAVPRHAALSLDKILAAVRKAHPQRYGFWTLEMPNASNGVITAWLEKPHETIRERYAPLMVSIDPYSGKIIASRFWGRTAGTWLLDLHTQLRLDSVGWNVVGCLGALLAMSVMTGLYLWWPGWVKLRRAFTVCHDAGLMRLLFDLHRLVGFCSAVALLTLAVTGFNLAFPAVLETLAGMQGVGHSEIGPDIRSSAVPNQRPVTLAEAVQVARGLFPHAELRRISTPDGENGTYRINLRQPDEINQRHPFTTVWVDRWSGQILEARNPNNFSSGQAFAAWMWPVHTGEALGVGGRMLWFIAGLVPLLLYVAGVVHWLHGRGIVGDRRVDLPAYRRYAGIFLERHIFRHFRYYGRLVFFCLQPHCGN